MNEMYEAQLARIATSDGFIAALDQSGGSTPKALASYGVSEDAWTTIDEMFEVVHAMRSRIMTSQSFDGRVLGAILFENTMDRDIDGLPTAAYLWQRKQVVPFVKCDAGLAEIGHGVQLMQDNPGLAALLERASSKGVFGTKMRSVVHAADETGIAALVAQQFAVGREILDAGLMPIIEPEVSIVAPDKAAAEVMTRAAIENELEALGDQRVMLKLTLPETAGHYDRLVAHKNVLRVVALSGGYGLDESCARLSRNPGIIASFSRVLTTGLCAGQEQPDFDHALSTTIDRIFEASAT